MHTTVTTIQHFAVSLANKIRKIYYKHWKETKKLSLLDDMNFYIKSRESTDKWWIKEFTKMSGYKVSM